MANTFSAVIEGWTRRVKEAEEAVFKEAAQELVKQLNDQVTEMIYDTPESPGYKRTGFLRASLMASTEAMPQLIRDNPGVTVNADAGDVILVIAGAELGQTIFLGYTAKYGAMVARGTSKMAPRPWVDLVAQRWQQIVAQKAAEVKARFGL
ncbi:HK97 gp10 family phage protein [Aquamicrobium terrae]|uniref:HK97 gp10 family phage protein n=1 Tax=Aquamicrobium terrae TaxID=1324945 RepID=A0ABV2MV29_9HYPH